MIQLRSANALGAAYAVLVFAQILTSGLGQQPGWRGFLLPRLQARAGGERYIWLLGTAWAVWHYPVTALQTISVVQNVTVVQAVVTILIALAGQTMSPIGMTYIHAWIVSHTRSVFLAILLHALAKVANTIVFSRVRGASRHDAGCIHAVGGGDHPAESIGQGAGPRPA